MNHTEKLEPRSESCDGIRIDWNVPIVASDGSVLRADVFRPDAEGRYPVIMSYGPYGKGLHFEDGYPSAWKLLTAAHPEVTRGSSCKYQCWEVVDPEKWVPDGYVCVRVDSRGAGCSAGYLDHFSPREAEDGYDCIEWAAAQAWCDGHVGLNGISYYAIVSWLIAGLNPPHLRAICVWEGAADHYRDWARHGGILNTFPGNWVDMQVATIQYGYGARGPRSRTTGEPVCGPQSFDDETLKRNRIDHAAVIRRERLDGPYYRERSAKWHRITVPLLSAANWGGQGLHPRGNFEGFVHAASRQKWLEVHGLEHWTHFMTDHGVDLQKRFFGHFLKRKDNGWEAQPPVQLQIRHPGEGFTLRHEQEWPLRRTQWTRFYLDGEMGLAPSPTAPPRSLTYTPLAQGLTFSTPPLQQEVEITGPVAAKLFLSSPGTDADVFLVLRVFDPQGKEVVFAGAIDPHTPVAQGWLRASHRKLDPEKSLPWRPYHTHDVEQPLIPGEIVELDIEIWPTCLVVPAGYRISLSILGRDYESDCPAVRLSNFKNELKGSGPFLHDDETDRPLEIFNQPVTIHVGPGHESHVLLPIIVADRTAPAASGAGGRPDNSLRSE